MPIKSFHELSVTLKATLKEVLPSMVDSRVNEIAKKTVPLYVAEGLLLDKQKAQPDVASIIAEAIQKEHENLRAEITLQVTNSIANSIPSQVDSFLRSYMANNILHVHPTQAASSSDPDLQYQLYLMMKDDEKLHNDDLSIWCSLKIKFEKPAPSVAPYRMVFVRTRDHEDHHDDDARLEGESSTKR
ncbi:hypothetical protein Tco_0707204 [Tanacetum coccineum]|uniref:Uncharacterized protein n=1 Tax=Tanacetum coccineum TaxID=301880 RepID=A0ABQ4YB57_9ASTR